MLIGALLVMALKAHNAALVLAMAIFLAAALAVQVLLRKRLPGVLAFLLVLSALLNGAGGSFEWFETYRWYDESIHLYTGFAGLAAIGYVYARDQALRPAALAWWCTAVGLALAVGWEVIEGLVGDLEAVDTASDIALGTIGSALGGLFAARLVAGTRAFSAGAARGTCGSR